jgi:hypothetical protein
MANTAQGYVVIDRIPKGKEISDQSLFSDSDQRLTLLIAASFVIITLMLVIIISLSCFLICRYIACPIDDECLVPRILQTLNYF